MKISPETLQQIRTIIGGRYIELYFLITVFIKLISLIYYAIRTLIAKHTFEKAKGEYQVAKAQQKQNPAMFYAVKKDATKKGKKYNILKHKSLWYLKSCIKSIIIIIIAVVLSYMTGIKSINELFQILFQEEAQ